MNIQLNLNIKDDFIAYVQAQIDQAGSMANVEEILHDYFMYKCGYYHDATYGEEFDAWFSENQGTYFSHDDIRESKSINESSEVSEIQRQFNNMKYIKGYKSYSSAYGNSFEIYTRFRLGDRVEVDLKVEKHAGKFGKIVPGFSKDNPDMLKVEFEDGGSAMIEKTFLQKVANEFGQ